MFLCNFLEFWIIHLLCLYEWTVRFDDNVALLKPFNNIRTSEPRMQLILAHINFTPNGFVVLLQLIQMVDSIVGNSNGADFPFLLSFYQSLPRTFTLLFTTIRCVKKNPRFRVSQISIRRRMLLRILLLTDQSSPPWPPLGWIQ